MNVHVQVPASVPDEYRAVRELGPVSADGYKAWLAFTKLTSKDVDYVGEYVNRYSEHPTNVPFVLYARWFTETYWGLDDAGRALDPMIDKLLHDAEQEQKRQAAGQQQ